VFESEWRRLARPWWLYAVRSAVVTGLLAGLGAVWWQGASRLDLSQVSQFAQAGEWYFEVIVAVQISMVLLAAPALTAGTFGTELVRGHVSLMMVSGLAPIEIVLGTLCARLLPVLLTAGCVIPVLALASHMGGIPPDALVRLEVVTLGTAVLACTLALALSVGARGLHEALMATYLLLLGWVLGYPVFQIIQTTSAGPYVPSGWTGWLLDVNPYWLALETILAPNSFRPNQEWVFLGGTLSLSLGIALLAAWRLRPVVLGAWARPSHRSFRSLRAFSMPTSLLDSYPVFWRECRAQKLSPWVRLLWGLYLIGAVLFTTLAVGECLSKGVSRTPWAGPFNGFQAAFGLGLLSLVTPAALAEDRARGSLEVLLSTPVSTRSLVLSKWFTYYRLAIGLALLPAVVAAAHAVPQHRWLGVLLAAAMVLAHGAAVTSLGMALATWLPRIDRALILSAAASILVTAAWVPLVAFSVQDKNLSLGLASASPLLGVGLLTSEMPRASSFDWQVRVGWAVFWILTYGAAALLLLWATLASFDRCVGRVSVRPRRVEVGRWVNLGQITATGSRPM
jgi:ABC-type transport system involved in multi-copper enzyme maturation permease subunit